MLLLVLLTACGYTVQDYWTDLAKAECQCNDDGDTWECRQDWQAFYESQDYYEACADDAAPVDRTTVKTWVKDYTENCQDPDTPLPEPEDADWFLSCEG